MSRISESIDAKWRTLAEQARADAQSMQPGAERDLLLKHARQLDSAAHMNGWLSSAELRRPIGK